MLFRSPLFVDVPLEEVSSHLSSLSSSSVSSLSLKGPQRFEHRFLGHR